ncbi:hypothetical protein L7F22_020160 [Adiantum nelumboides]|nr:hypothetical protein [Adiantum nelumboides]
MMVGVTATRLDGKATLAAILDDLTGRVSALTAAGRTPGLGTVLVGDDPGSHSYVRGKHNDCAKVGITSLRRDLPADATQADVEAAIDELNADPACTGYIVQLPLPKGLDSGAALERIDPDKDADGLHPTNLGRLVLQEPGPLPCTPRGVVELLRRYDVPLDGAKVTILGPRGDRGTAPGPAALAAQRERHGDALPHRDEGPGGRAARRRRRGRRGRRAGARHRRHGQARRGGARRRHHPRRERPGRGRRARGGRGRGLPRPRAGRGRADDPRHGCSPTSSSGPNEAAEEVAAADRSPSGPPSTPRGTAVPASPARARHPHRRHPPRTARPARRVPPASRRRTTPPRARSPTGAAPDPGRPGPAPRAAAQAAAVPGGDAGRGASPSGGSPCTTARGRHRDRGRTAAWPPSCGRGPAARRRAARGAGQAVDVVTYALGGVVLVLVALTITGGPLATR